MICNKTRIAFGFLYKVENYRYFLSGGALNTIVTGVLRRIRAREIA